MTRKHFEAIAAILAARIPHESEPAAAGFDEGYETGIIITVEGIAEDFADYLATTNPNFDRAKLLKACGV